MLFGALPPAFASKTTLHECLDILGTIVVFLCALGRIYCTAFLGGHKNNSLVTYGPFSVSRNPLYFCSFLGACGIGLISNHVTLMIVLPLTFCLVYFSLIKREEVYLTAEFGDAYREYCAQVPRFFPDFKRYSVPETVTLYPRFLHNGIKDSIAWLCVLPFFETVEYLQRSGVLQTYFLLP